LAVSACVSFSPNSLFSILFPDLSLPVGILDFGSDCSDFLFKFLVIGSAGTGKSCLLHQFIENKCEFLAVVLGALSYG
jgi:hypothetical protein